MTDPRHSYSTAAEGSAQVRQRYTITGRMNVSDYLAFVAERATWFGVGGWVKALDETSVTLLAAGPEAMVGALEMACTLGPMTALVEHVDGVDEAGPTPVGFEIRQK
jgi:acylphosphatase